jgi:hypothetical protein
VGAGTNPNPIVEGSRVVIFRVHRHRSYSSNVGRVERSQRGVFEQPRTEPLAMPARGDGQAREQHQRNRMLGESFSEALWRVVVLDLSHDKRVEHYDLIALPRPLRVSEPASRGVTNLRGAHRA